MKSAKSFRAKASMNQEYSQKILDLEKAVRHIERINEKRVRLHKAPVLAAAHRINSLRELKRQESSPLTAKSSFMSDASDEGVVTSPPRDETRQPSSEIKSSGDLKNLFPRKKEEVVTSVAAAPDTIPILPPRTIELEPLQLFSTPPPKAPSRAPTPVLDDSDTATKLPKVPKPLKLMENPLRTSSRQPSLDKAKAEEALAEVHRQEMENIQLRKIEQEKKEAEEKERNEIEVAKEKLKSAPQREKSISIGDDADQQQSAMDALLQLKRVEVEKTSSAPSSNSFIAMAKDSLRRRTEDAPAETSADSHTNEAGEPQSRLVQLRKVEMQGSQVDENTENSEVVPSERSSIEIARESLRRVPVKQDSVTITEDGDTSTAPSVSDHTDYPPRHRSSIPRSGSDGDAQHNNTANHGTHRDDDVDSVSSHFSNLSNQQQQLSTPQRHTSGSKIDSLMAKKREEGLSGSDVGSPVVPILRAKDTLNPVVVNEQKHVLSREEESKRLAAPILQVKETLRPVSIRDPSISMSRDPQGEDPNLASLSIDPLHNGSGDSAGLVNPPATEFERKASIFGKLMRKASGLVDKSNPATSNLSGNNGAALFEQAARIDEGQNESHRSSDDGNHRHEDDDDDLGGADILHDDDFLKDIAVPLQRNASQTTNFAASTSNASANNHGHISNGKPFAATLATDVQVVSLTKANLERTRSLRDEGSSSGGVVGGAEGTTANGPGMVFRDSFHLGHHGVKPVQEDPSSKSGAAVDISTSPLKAGAVDRPDDRQLMESESIISGSDTGSKKKKGRNLLKGIRKRTSFMFGGSKSTSNHNLDMSETGSQSDAGASPLPESPSRLNSIRGVHRQGSQSSEVGSVSDIGFDDSASNQGDSTKKKSRGSSLTKMTSSLFRRRSSNLNTADEAIPEDRAVDFPSPTGGLDSGIAIGGGSETASAAAGGEGDLDDNASQTTSNAEKKRRLTMKGLMKRTSSLFR